MAFCQNTFRSLAFALFFVVVATSTSFGQSLDLGNLNDKTVPTVSDIARQIEEQALVQTDHKNTDQLPQSVSEAVSKIVYILPLGDKDRFHDALEQLEHLAQQKKNPYDEGILDLFTRYSEYYNFNKVTDNYETITRFLTDIPDTEHWLVRFHAKRLLSVTHTHNRNNALALQVAESALELIPNEISPEAIDTRISATSLIAYLQNLQFNKEIALINTQRLIDLKLAANQPIDGIELLNNLMYSHNAWRDNEIRLSLAQTLIRLEDKYGSTSPGLSHLHASGIYIDIGQYDKAKSAALTALSQVKHETLKTAASLNLASAHAGLGEIVQAKELMASLSQRAQNSSKGTYAQALIALKEGRVDEALTLMNKRYDDRVRRFLTDGSNNTLELLASLENSSERQAERESALKREAALIQTRLNQQQKINRLLITLSALALFMGIGAIIFARHRDKLSKMLKIKTEEAESADRMKTEFLGMVSHELRTPLNGIIGLADIMASQSEDKQTRGRASIILESGNALFNLIESIIDMSRLDGGKMELVAQDTSIAEIAQHLSAKWQKEAEAKGLIFTSHIPPNVAAEVEIDPVRIGQCIDTLLSNAIRFTEEGRVHMHLGANTDPETGHLNFSVIVADTGQGISEEVQGKLFTPFLQADTSMTRKHGGSGLRLAIARAMARMMNGDVTLISREGRGSEFTLTFSAPQALAYKSSDWDIESNIVSPLAQSGKQGDRRREAREESGNDRRSIRRPQTRINPQAEIEEYVYSALDTSADENTQDQEQGLESLAASEALSPVRDENSVFNDLDEEGNDEALFSAIHKIESDLNDSAADAAKDGQSGVNMSKSGGINGAAADKEELLKSLKDSRILIVDDLESNQDVIELMLKAAQVNCFAVESGEDALNMLDAYRFDVVIMDIRMPGMDGIETTKRIRQCGKSWSDVPVLALTADTAAENNIACIEAGANAFLTKPVTTQNLLGALKYLKDQHAKAHVASAPDTASPSFNPALSQTG